MQTVLNRADAFGVLFVEPKTSKGKSRRFRGTLRIEDNDPWSGVDRTVALIGHTEWKNGTEIFRFTAGNLSGSFGALGHGSSSGNGPDFEGAAGAEYELCVIGWELSSSHRGELRILLMITR